MNLSLAISYARPGSQWNLTANDYATLQWFGPGDQPTMEELQQAWDELQTIKIWTNVQSFMAEFTMPEKAQIALSTDPTLAALRLELSAWLSDVYSNDQRVVTGLDKLVELDIITAQRKAEIITP